MNGTGHALSSWLFLRVLGIIYAVAFLSLGLQVKGLIGEHGILPARDFLTTQKQRLATARFWLLPTLCWGNDSDRFLQALCWSGIVLAALLIAGVAPVLLLVLLWLLYLSLFHVGQIFLGYQWDVLLLETGFFAIFLAPLELTSFEPAANPPPLALLLMYWILFRLMFFSGVVKLRSADPAWHNLTALCHHYQTQPLPTPAAWYAWQLPPVFHRLSAAVMFAVELAVPFLIFGPQSLRYFAAVTILALMVLIQVTGNYGFFNIITIALALLLFDDSIYAPLLQSIGFGPRLPPINPAWPPWILWTIAALVLVLSFDRFVHLFRRQIKLPNWLTKLDSAVSPFHLVNSYGLFSIMTTERPEIIIEGSDDGVVWHAYEFRFKPGDVRRRPPVTAPHQPRLDWQMWFAALGGYQMNPWLMAFLARLLQGRPEVRRLLAKDPFAGAAPKYIRAVVYDYRFTDRRTKGATGAWWRRERKWLYCHVLSLRGIEKELMPPKDFI